MLKSSLIGRAIIITEADGSAVAPILLLEIALDCPECGQHVVRIAGHHLRTLRKLLTSVIDANPDLTGTEESSELLEQYEWSGPQGNPQNN